MIESSPQSIEQMRNPRKDFYTDESFSTYETQTTIC